MNICRFDRTRAYIKIEDGCESRCTYCIIPKARGKIRSKSPSDVLDEVNTLIAGGCREIVLTGIETASYGKDIEGCDFAELLTLVDKVEGIGRVRLGSLDPSSITEKFVEKIAPLSSLAPHFHLSLQSGSDRILALMKRRYNSKMAMNVIERLRSAIPNVQFTTDVIVGFPGETEEDFLRTLEFCQKAHFLKIHIFPYSKREGTPAASMPEQISKEVKRDRLQRLSEVERASRFEILNKAVTDSPVCEVLFETFDEKNKRVVGHTSNFFEVSAPSDIPLHSELRKVRLTSTDGETCFGEIIL
jgi:threonylcarbamoyladenosine tRNA methylthiotransferase MtaB